MPKSYSLTSARRLFSSHKFWQVHFTLWCRSKMSASFLNLLGSMRVCQINSPSIELPSDWRPSLTSVRGIDKLETSTLSWFPLRNALGPSCNSRGWRRHCAPSNIDDQNTIATPDCKEVVDIVQWTDMCHWQELVWYCCRNNSVYRKHLWQGKKRREGDGIAL